MIVVAVVLAASARADAPWKAYAAKSDDWYRGAEGRQVAANIRSWQSPRGDWPKNTDNSARPQEGDPARIQVTFDNGATVGELRFLARAFRATGDAPDHDVFLKGLDHILGAQYPTGGWPQTSPPGKGYVRYITFNDNTMVNLMELLRDVATSDSFQFVDTSRRARASKAFESGIACILKCQVEVGGVPTVWCAQHDEVALAPRPARTFELVSLSGSESAGILLLLMSLDHPSPEAVRAVEAGARWFDKTKLNGFRQEVVERNKVIVADPNAPPLWARFSEVDTNRPFFSGRDGIKKYQMAEIEAERRNGYAWYGGWGSKVRDRYAAWSRAQAAQSPAH